METNFSTALLLSLCAFVRAGFAQQFEEVTSSVGFVNQLKNSWGNPIWGDMNNDGFIDLIVPTHGLGASRGPMVYLNRGGSRFTDARKTCQLGLAPELDSRDWHGFAFGDYDNDGSLDLYVAEGSKEGTMPKRDLLFHGAGNGVFAYISDTAGMLTNGDRGRCGFWFDFDNDGKLDLFVKNYFGSNRLYHNNGDGTFTNSIGGSGLGNATLGQDRGTICSFNDYDNDDFVDVFFTGDTSTDALYHNNCDGTFTDVTSAAGIKSLGNGHGIAWGDYDNDGLIDLFVPRGHLGDKGITGATLYRNIGNGTFTDGTDAAGLTTTANLWSAVWGDYNNDGYLDLFVTNGGLMGQGQDNSNFLYQNNGSGSFAEVALAAGVALEDGINPHKTAAWGDYDNDGFLDLVIKDGIGNEGDNGSAHAGLHRLFRNSGNTNHFLKVLLLGVQSNRQGIGSRVAVTYNGTTSYRQNNGGGGGEYASQGSEPLHFGIGVATTADVNVIWPSGATNSVIGVAANSTITVVEGATPH